MLQYNFSIKVLRLTQWDDNYTFATDRLCRRHIVKATQCLGECTYYCKVKANIGRLSRLSRLRVEPLSLISRYNATSVIVSASNHGAWTTLWFRTTKNVCTGPLVHSLLRSHRSLISLLITACFVHTSAALIRFLARSLIPELVVK